jgi:hypothetical protein
VLFGNVNTSGFQKYLDPVTLSADTTLTTPDAAHVLFDKTVDSATGGNRKLDVTSGVTTFVGNVGVSSALTSLLVKGKAQLSTSVGITVHTQGSQTYEGGAVTLGTSATLQLDNDLAAATFKDTVDGGKLEIEGVGGNAVFKKAVGLTDPLTSLSVEKTSAIDGGFVETTGFQTYAGAVTLGADTELKTGANIGFGSTLDAKAAGEQSLTINAGSTTFGGLVGFNDALEFLDVTGTATLNADSITTELHQTYRNTLTLAADATLHATSISFAGVEGQSHNLTLDASDTVSQNAQAIRAGDVALMGGGRFVLNNLANDIASVYTRSGPRRRLGTYRARRYQRFSQSAPTDFA